MNPKARVDVLSNEVAGELLVYVDDRKEAHCLNRTAALVWRHCDGTKGVPELVEILKAELGPEADDELVRVALDRLREAQLLESGDRYSRRELGRKMGTAAALTALLPVVTSVVAPTAAMAGSNGNSNGQLPGQGGGNDDKPKPKPKP
jgi:hypothetical protein